LIGCFHVHSAFHLQNLRFTIFSNKSMTSWRHLSNLNLFFSIRAQTFTPNQIVLFPFDIFDWLITCQIRKCQNTPTHLQLTKFCLTFSNDASRAKFDNVNIRPRTYNIRNYVWYFHVPNYKMSNSTIADSIHEIMFDIFEWVITCQIRNF